MPVIITIPMTVLLRLGYSSAEINSTLIDYIDIPTDSDRAILVQALVTKLDLLDTKIEQAEEDSMLGKSCEGEFHWSAHLRYLRTRGHEILLEIARILSVKLMHSKYASSTGRKYFLSY